MQPVECTIILHTHLSCNSLIWDLTWNQAHSHASQTNQQLIVKDYLVLMHHMAFVSDAETRQNIAMTRQTFWQFQHAQVQNAACSLYHYITHSFVLILNSLRDTLGCNEIIGREIPRNNLHVTLSYIQQICSRRLWN